MISHVHVGIGDFERAFAFYSVVLPGLGLELKFKEAENAPGLRPHYHAHYYGAYFRDPDGNKLCVCCHQPEPAQ